MAIRDFDVGGVRGLVRAQASSLPNIVGIAGPNGAGKSTLLETLRARKGDLLEPGTEMLYIGPHRSWRSSQLSEMHVLGFPFGFDDVLKQDSIPSFQYGQPTGLHFLGGLSRQAATADDSQALVKTAIVRLHNQQRDLVNTEYIAQGGKVSEGSVPDLIAPLRQLVSTLLPHLELIEVDGSQTQNILVMFGRADVEDQVRFDIDELSSGEKAAIALFLPFVEQEAKRLRGDAGPVGTGVVPVTVLLDEPEIHLHPLLQLNVIEYMRQLAQEGRAQFIFTTQSPVLLDALEEQELYVLSPPGFITDNQLSPLVSGAEKLELARGLTGSTHLLTRAKPIVFVEGERSERPAAATDERLIRLMIPVAAHWAIAPARGRADVVAAARSLRGVELRLPGIPVFGLVDSDTSLQGLPEYVIGWPVAMIENLLLDHEALWGLLEPHEAVTGLRSPVDVHGSLMAIASERESEEVRLRAKRAMPGRWVQVELDGEGDAGPSVEAAITAIRDTVAKVDTREVRAAAVAEVRRLIADGQQLEHFHGKAILQGFYKRHDLSQVFSLAGFSVEAARACSGRERLQRLAMPAVNRIRYYFPGEIESAIQQAAQSDERDALAARANLFRSSWEGGSPTGVGRDDFRTRLGVLARSQDPALGARLFALANAVGTD